MRFLKRSSTVDPDQLDRQADESMRLVEQQRDHVNALTGWLERRKNQNGFGTDFEYSLIPKESR